MVVVIILRLQTQVCKKCHMSRFSINLLNFYSEPLACWSGEKFSPCFWNHLPTNSRGFHHCSRLHAVRRGRAGEFWFFQFSVKPDSPWEAHYPTCRVHSGLPLLCYLALLGSRYYSWESLRATGLVLFPSVPSATHHALRSLPWRSQQGPSSPETSSTVTPLSPRDSLPSTFAFAQALFLLFPQQILVAYHLGAWIISNQITSSLHR